MASLSEITAFLDEKLRIAEIPDYGGAMNGLQLEGGGEVKKVVAAVDASAPVIEKAVAAGGDLLVVHHGMFWGGAQPLTGAFFRKIKAAMDAGMAIYSAHLPLDVHPEWGNNACLARAIGLKVGGGFLDYKGIEVGLTCEWSGSRDALVDAVGQAVGGGVRLCPGGHGEIRPRGLCSGEAVGGGGRLCVCGAGATRGIGPRSGRDGAQVVEAAAAGIEAFITGEGPHHTYGLAEELGINLIYAGHYATETFGVKALAAALGERFGLASGFVDHPTGL